MPNSLTGMPRRQLFSKILSVEINQAKNKKQKLVVVLSGVDRFRKINNSLGHAAGDKLLEAVAKRLKTPLEIKKTRQLLKRSLPWRTTLILKSF